MFVIVPPVVSMETREYKLLLLQPIKRIHSGRVNIILVFALMMPVSVGCNCGRSLFSLKSGNWGIKISGYFGIS